MTLLLVNREPTFCPSPLPLQAPFRRFPCCWPPHSLFLWLPGLCHPTCSFFLRPFLNVPMNFSPPAPCRSWLFCPPLFTYAFVIGFRLPRHQLLCTELGRLFFATRTRFSQSSFHLFGVKVLANFFPNGHASLPPWLQSRRSVPVFDCFPLFFLLCSPQVPTFKPRHSIIRVRHDCDPARPSRHPHPFPVSSTSTYLIFFSIKRRVPVATSSFPLAFHLLWFPPISLCTLVPSGTKPNGRVSFRTSLPPLSPLPGFPPPRIGAPTV